MAKRSGMRNLAVGLSLFALAGCMGDTAYVATSVDEGGYGKATLNNMLVETGQRSYVIDLSRRFAQEVPNTVNFAFDSATLDATARAVIQRQAAWIRQFPEVRFRVYGYTDLVGTEAYNKVLGLRRAEAVVAYLVSLGVPRAHLQAVVSYGKTHPLIPVATRERANRRAITDVAGFVRNAPMVLDGKYAEIVYRNYVTSAAPAPGGQVNSLGASGSKSGTSGGSGSNAGGLSGATLPGSTTSGGTGGTTGTGG